MGASYEKPTSLTPRPSTRRFNVVSYDASTTNALSPFNFWSYAIQGTCGSSLGRIPDQPSLSGGWDGFLEWSRD